MRGERGGEREIKRETETLLENFEYFNDFSLKINWTKLEQKDNFKKITFRKQLLKISIFSKKFLTVYVQTDSEKER